MYMILLQGFCIQNFGFQTKRLSTVKPAPVAAGTQFLKVTTFEVFPLDRSQIPLLPHLLSNLNQTRIGLYTQRKTFTVTYLYCNS